jgi:3-hydroxybutyryl-CoA dehydrogenase
MSMDYSIVVTGASRSFPEQHDFLKNASRDADVVFVLGNDIGSVLPSLKDKKAIVVELGTECLGVHAGESRGDEGSNILGFARYRLGDAPPTNLVELVKQPKTDPAALAAAKQAFESAGLGVAVCGDFPGRIVDRLLRPYLNAALRRLDEGLATADDMDTTLRLGLGYPEGPIALLDRTGLAAHFEVAQALYEALGDPAYAPARRARVAFQRRASSKSH